jgi:hypothetical protein
MTLGPKLFGLTRVFCTDLTTLAWSSKSVVHEYTCNLTNHTPCKILTCVLLVYFKLALIERVVYGHLNVTKINLLYIQY